MENKESKSEDFRQAERAEQLRVEAERKRIAYAKFTPEQKQREAKQKRIAHDTPEQKQRDAEQKRIARANNNTTETRAADALQKREEQKQKGATKTKSLSTTMSASNNESGLPPRQPGGAASYPPNGYDENGQLLSKQNMQLVCWPPCPPRSNLGIAANDDGLFLI